jgi:peptidyl-prolyl cis-trans isomerase C
MASAVVAVALSTLTACAPTPTPDTLATWGSGTVTVAQLDAAIRELPAARRQPAAGQSLEDWIGHRVADLALPEILLDRARQPGIDDRSALELRARYAASQEVGRAYLFSRCPAEEIGDELLAARLEQDPGEEQAWILVRHIYKRAEADAPAAERQAAFEALAALHDELEAGASFTELARLHSDSETAEDGGLIGRISERAPVEERVRDAAWALADGEYSAIVEVENGYHLLLRESSGVTPRPSLDQMREQLRRQEVLSRRDACGREVLAQLGREMPVRVDRDALLDPDDDSRPVLSIGEEQFTATQLAGLSADLTPLLLTPRPGELLRHFSEAVLLAREASEGGASGLPEIEARELRKILVEAQWRRERRRLAATRPEAELRAYFEDHRERFRSDLELDVGLILVVSEGEPGRRAAMERAQAIRRRLVDGEAFETLARTESAHTSSDRGGRLGPLPLPRLRVILGSRGIARAAKLAADDVSEPVQIQDPPAAAFALVKLYGRVDPQPRSFDEARDDVIETLSQERIQQLDGEVRERLLAEADFALLPEAIASYVARLND